MAVGSRSQCWSSLEVQRQVVLQVVLQVAQVVDIQAVVHQVASHGVQEVDTHEVVDCGAHMLVDIQVVANHLHAGRASENLEVAGYAAPTNNVQMDASAAGQEEAMLALAVELPSWTSLAGARAIAPVLHRALQARSYQGPHGTRECQ
jgi:hypothetical protein